MAKNKQKITLTLPPVKPRNPYVAAALTRRAGCHSKPSKVARQQSRQRMQRALGELLVGATTEFDID